MEGLKLYRKRIIPEECVFLKDDFLLYRDREVIVTKWSTLKPKKTLSHGYSCYFLERGFKVSKFYDHEDRLISWYCDIIQTKCTKEEDGTETYVFTDLLADVIVYPDGQVRVVDLDELADSTRVRLIRSRNMWTVKKKKTGGTEPSVFLIPSVLSVLLIRPAVLSSARSCPAPGREGQLPRLPFPPASPLSSHP